MRRKWFASWTATLTALAALVGPLTAIDLRASQAASADAVEVVGMSAPRMLSAKSRPVADDVSTRIVALDAQMRTSLAPGGYEPTVDEAVWRRLAECEADGDWEIDTGNGYYGGLQFALTSWKQVGGRGHPHEASKRVQIAMAERLLEQQGWQAWPSCSRQLGLR